MSETSQLFRNFPPYSDVFRNIFHINYELLSIVMIILHTLQPVSQTLYFTDVKRILILYSITTKPAAAQFQYLEKDCATGHGILACSSAAAELFMPILQ